MTRLSLALSVSQLIMAVVPLISVACILLITGGTAIVNDQSSESLFPALSSAYIETLCTPSAKGVAGTYHTLDELTLAFSVMPILSSDIVTEVGLTPQSASDRSALIRGVVSETIESGGGCGLSISGEESTVKDQSCCAELPRLSSA
ncbi:hypothetical protein ES703_70449 [subsurface metagenome]